MKKDLLNWMTILMVAIVSVGFVSCGDDDDDDKKASASIVGTWRNSWGDDPRGYTAYSFFDDGTGLMFDKGNGAERFTYSFSSQTQIVSIEYNEYNTDQINVSNITSNALIMDGDEYRKVELTYDMLILGEWFLHVDPRNTIDKETRVIFYADDNIEATGFYEAKDYFSDAEAMKEVYYSFSGLSGKVRGTWSITGNRLSIKGSSQIAGEYIIEGLVVNGCRLVRASNPDEYPYLIGGWNQR